MITHPHPDHYAGLATITRNDVPVVSTADVAQIIRRDDPEKDAIVRPMMGDQWPPERPSPNQLVETGDTVELGGLAFSVRDLGAGESHADTVWALDDTTLFTGDLAYNDMHAYLADAHHEEWIAQLDRLHAQLPDQATLYVGHGEPGSKHLLTAQRHYVEAFVHAVQAAADHDSEPRTRAVTAAMQNVVANDRLLFLMQRSIEPVLATIRGTPV